MVIVVCVCVSVCVGWGEGAGAGEVVQLLDSTLSRSFMMILFNLLTNTQIYVFNNHH